MTTAVLEGEVRDLTAEGEGAVVTAQGTVLTAGALPGERVRLRLGRRRRGARRGKLVEVLEASPERVEPACAHQTRCGGCPWMTLQLDAQRRLKRARVERALEGLGAATPRVEMITGESGLGYRARARLSWVEAKAGVQLGYRAAGGRHVVDTPSCRVLDPRLAAALGALRATLAPRLRGTGEVELGHGLAAGAMVRLDAAAAQPPEVYAACERLAADPAVDGVELSVEGLAPARWGESGQADGELRAGAAAFAQANAVLNRTLVERVVTLADCAGARVLELYAGYGNFTVPLAREAASLRAVESDPAAAQACRDNLKRLGLSARVVAGQAEEHAAGSRVDVVVLDPPRAGARGALAGLVARRPARIVYVSCDPATLARDLRELAAAGYLPDTALALDMFPQTGHVEAVVRLLPAAEVRNSPVDSAGRSGFSPAAP